MTIPKSIRFTATVSKEGTIRLPEGTAPEGSTLEVVLYPAVAAEENLTPSQFVEKWKGFFKGAEDLNLDDAKYQHIMKKHGHTNNR